LKDAAAVNSTRWALYQRLKETGLDVETGSSGRTKWNRTQQQYPKAHWIDAACVGESGTSVKLNPNHKILYIKAMGHGERQRARLDRFGFPRGHKPRAKSYLGFKTGDIVRCAKPSMPVFDGRVAIRFRPSFVISSGKDKKEAHPKYLTIIQKGDGYDYAA